MYSEDQLAADALADVGLLANRTPLSEYTNPADFIENEMYIPETPGVPLKLHPEIRGVLEKMFERRPDGTLRYMTMIFSAIKKTGKTTIAGGVALWQAYHVPDGEIYIIGNDLDQANSRQMEAIRYCLMHNPRMADVRLRQNTALLPNGTKIRALAVDAAGESGANPTGIFWTEIWGAKQKKHEDFFTEMVLSPTRQGHSFKFCESYAGHTSESRIWERLYNAAVKNHPPAYPDISPELYEDGSTIAFWCTRRLMPWQQGEAADLYYAQEAKEKTPSEYRRQHMNEWTLSEDTFVNIALWDACQGEIPPMGQFQSVVLGVDAGVSSDTFGIVAFSRTDQQLYVRYARRWIPPPGGRLDFYAPDGPADAIRWLDKQYRVSEINYDEFQLHVFATELGKEVRSYFRVFSQGQDRAIADKALRDYIVQRRITHSGEPDLREHIMNANAKAEGERLRIVKRAEHLKVDLAVAAAMSASRAAYLNIS